MTSHLTLFGMGISGHTHRVRLLLDLLGLAYDYREVAGGDLAGEAFGQLNPLRQVPVLTDGDLVIADSNAILLYLAHRYDEAGHWLPRTALDHAELQRWFSISAGEIRFGPARARLIRLLGFPGDIAEAQGRAGLILGVIENHLAQHSHLGGNRPTLADLSCYAYVACAPDGGISLEPYKAIRAWLARLEAMPRFRPMPLGPPVAAVA